MTLNPCGNNTTLHYVAFIDYEKHSKEYRTNTQRYNTTVEFNHGGKATEV